MRGSYSKGALFTTVVAAGALLGAGAVRADDAAQNATVNELRQQLTDQQQQIDSAQQKLEEQLQELKAQRQALQKQQQQIDALQTAVVAPAAGNASPPAGAARTLKALFQPPRSPSDYGAVGAAIPAADTQAQTPSAPVGQPPANQEERPEISDLSLASQGGVLTPKGVFSFEPTYQYQYTSANQVLINGLTIVPGVTIGSASVRQLVDRMNTFTLGGRLGITDRFEVEAEVPYVRRGDDTNLQPLTANGSVTSISSSGSGLGDVQFGAHYQIDSGAGGWPYFVGNVLVKSNTGKSPFDVPLDFNTGIPTQLATGTGFWAVQPSVTAIYPSDPVVFFANLRYIKIFGDEVTLQPTVNTNPTPTRVQIDPGDGVGGSFGMGFGINDKASFSLAYEHTFVMSTSQNGATIPGSSFDVGQFDLGFSYQVSQRISTNLGIQIGATKAAPDAAITLRVPVKFQVFQ